MEQIVVLALTSIVLLISFTAILNFQRLIMKVQKNAGVDRSLYILHKALENDFRNSSFVSWDGSLNISKPLQTVKYEFEKQILIRGSKESTDTFRFVTNDLNVRFIKGNDTLVESVTFRIPVSDQNYSYMFFKEYPESFLWELNYQK